MTSPMKVALVTASSAGLGAAIAKHLVTDMHVVINYSSNESRSLSTLKEMQDIVQSRQYSSPNETPQVNIIRADLSNRVDIESLISQTIALHGRLDILVSNGGWTEMRNFMDLDDNLNDDDWEKCFTVNVKSHLWLIKAARRYLEEHEGSFVTIGSVSGFKAGGSSIPYSVTKAAHLHLVKCLAKVTAPKIRVNCVSPGLMMTNWGKRFPQEFVDKASDLSLLKRIATLEDVAVQVRTLALNRSMTGQNLVVDAGYSFL